MRWLSRLLIEIIRLPYLTIWHLTGWRMDPLLPDIDKYIIIAVPHTTNMDFFHMLAMALTVRRRPNVTFKHTWFWFPMNIFLRAIGGIPINRDKAMNVVDELSESIKSADRMVLVFTPEGTRSKRNYWKTGFYYTAVKTNLPIVCGFIDYKAKRCGYGMTLYPTGDIRTDFEKIRQYYLIHGQNGKYPERISELQIKPRHYKMSHFLPADADKTPDPDSIESESDEHTTPATSG